jgi:hypothetical protein
VAIQPQAWMFTVEDLEVQGSRLPSSHSDLLPRDLFLS